MLKAFEALHPDAPPSLQCTITKKEWKHAVLQNYISLLPLARGVSEVKFLDSIEAKLLALPDIEPLIGWYIDWIKSVHKAGRNPTYKGMEQSGNSKGKHPTTLSSVGNVRYTQKALAILDRANSWPMNNRARHPAGWRAGDASNKFPNTVTDFPQFFSTPSKAKNPISFKESTPYPIP